MNVKISVRYYPFRNPARVTGRAIVERGTARSPAIPFPFGQLRKLVQSEWGSPLHSIIIWLRGRIKSDVIGALTPLLVPFKLNVPVIILARWVSRWNKKSEGPFSVECSRLSATFGNLCRARERSGPWIVDVVAQGCLSRGSSEEGPSPICI